MAGFGKRQAEQQEQLEQLVGGGSLRSAFAFCVLGLLAAVFLAPMLNSNTQQVATIEDKLLPDNIDRTVTGSVEADQSQATPPRNGTVRYTIRRSVIQKNPSEPCYIYENGATQGDC